MNTTQSPAPRRVRILGAALLLSTLGLGLAGPSAAQTESDRTVRLETIEGLFGITPTAGAVGDGRLTAQVTLEGTISCMRWPNATFYEHVKHRAGTYDEDPALNAWNLPHYGAKENAGFFAGIRYDDGGTDVTQYWLRDGEIDFAYASEDANRLVATYTFPDGTEVEESTFVVPETPALIRTYRLNAAPSGAKNLRLIVFANPALRDDYGNGYDPRPQFDGDDNARFATFAVPQDDALLSALPGEREDLLDAVWDLFDGDPTATETGAFVLDNAAAWGTGTYMAQGASVDMAAFQVGTDRELADRGGQDAYRDATDGTLSKHPIAVEFETTAMELPIAAGGDPVAWYGAFATDAVAALDVLADLRGTEPAGHEAASDQWWADWLEGAVLPTQSDRARAFGKRALISLRTGFDPESGAIIASTSCQPPYNLDWPRDGAFFQFALELNDKRFEAAKHARFYNGLNAEKRIYGPIGSWAMNYYADGTPGGPIDFEIDEVGFGLWVYRQHAAFLGVTDPVAAKEFLLEVSESTWLAGDLLAECKDDDPSHPNHVDPRLQCPANEDDNEGFVVTLHGAITTWLGVRSAADIAHSLNQEERAATYDARAEELAAGIRDHFHPANGETPEGVGKGNLGWSYWPARFWDADDTAAHEATRRLMIEGLSETLVVDKTGTQYDQKSSMVLAMPPLRNAETEDFVAQVHDTYLNEVVSDLNHQGEGTVHDDFDGDGVEEWKNITALPHIWAQTLTYLSLLAEEDPSHLQEPALDLADVDVGAGLGDGEGEGGGGCSVASPGATALPAWLVVLGLWGLLRRRRR